MEKLTDEILKEVERRLEKEPLTRIAKDLGLNRKSLGRRLEERGVLTGFCKFCGKPLQGKGTCFCSTSCSNKYITTQEGYVCSLSDKAVREKIKKTNLEKYGSENPMGNSEVRQKVKKTNLERYGTENPGASEKVKKKIKETFVENYGATSPWLNREFVEKKVRKRAEEKGYEYPFQSEEVQDKVKKTNLEKYGREYIGGLPQFMDKISETTLKNYGVPYGCLTENCISSQGKVVSEVNKKWADLLGNCSFEKNIKGSSFDLEYNGILIEINPSYTHNSTRGAKFGKFEAKPKAPQYHYLKTKLATDNGYRCINIWDWDDPDKILSLIKSTDTVLYARKGEIREVSIEESKEFLEKYHLQGFCRGQEIRLGLYFEGKLTQIMTFGSPRYNKNYQYELLRLCSTCKVVGGAEKLFSYFIEKYSPKSIISYCDLSKFTGKVYERLGFFIKRNPPAKHWYNIKTKQHIRGSLLALQGADRLLGVSYGRGTSNEEILISEGFVCIYDCGQAVYTIEFNQEVGDSNVDKN